MQDALLFILGRMNELRAAGLVSSTVDNRLTPKGLDEYQRVKNMPFERDDMKTILIEEFGVPAGQLHSIISLIESDKGR